ncbi:MAG: dihydrolipoyl dehydrogenase [Candidatus Obscuribacterales bacterium]|nr:dihydrolipoyl dehydrogenase [Candidatus Obscuribacterales bacterium]
MVVGEMVQDVQLVVLGAGPGGYTAALRAAELGIKTILVDTNPKPGGTCLHVGCIPSKALLHAAEVTDEAKKAATFGLNFAPPTIELDKLRSWKESILDKLSGGIAGKCKSAGVEVMTGKAEFKDSRNVRVDVPGESAVRIKFKHCIIATGSRPVMPAMFDIGSPRVMDSTGALKIEDVPASLLIVGGGYIGLEMGTVYAALGSQVYVVEMTDGLLPGCDRDLVRPLQQHLQGTFKSIWLNTKVTKLEADGTTGVKAYFDGKDAPAEQKFDRVLISVGRRPNTDGLGLETTQAKLDDHGFVVIDEQCRTSDKRIFAIGDASGQPMLAHRAIRQGLVAAEVIAGKKSAFDNRAIPAVVFTQPEIAWVGLTDTEAKAKGLEVGAAKFPWSANGRAHTLADPTGQTKVLFDPETMRVLGIGLVGPRAGELVSEAALAIEMGAVLEDLAVTIHTHPTLSETINEAALAALSRLERQAKRETTTVS